MLTKDSQHDRTLNYVLTGWKMPNIKYDSLYPNKQSFRTLLKVGLVANIFEYYELAMFSYMAQIIAQLFFSSASQSDALLKTLATFSLSYLSKPLGAFYFGHLGDRYGKKLALKRSMMMMALPVTLVGLLPTWHTGGTLATCLLACLRIMQGFASGGEGPISISYVSEAASLKHRSLLCSSVHISALLGMLSASGVSTLLFHYFSEAEILAWAWRIPFLINIPATIGISWIRRAVIDFPQQINTHAIAQNPKHANQTQQAIVPIKLWKASPQQTIATLLIASFFMATAHILLGGWFTIYLVENFGYAKDVVNITHTIALSTRVLFCTAAAYLARFVGPKPLMISSLVLSTGFIIPFFKLLSDHPPFMSLLGIYILFILLLSGIDGIFVERMASLFSQDAQCRGMSWHYTGLSTFFGSTTVVLCSYMVNGVGIQFFPCFYLLFWGTLASFAVYLMLRSERPS